MKKWTPSVRVTQLDWPKLRRPGPTQDKPRQPARGPYQVETSEASGPKGVGSKPRPDQPQTAPQAPSARPPRETGMMEARAAQKAAPESQEQKRDRPGHGDPDKNITTVEDLKEYMRRRAEDRDRRLGGQGNPDRDEQEGVDHHGSVKSPRSGKKPSKTAAKHPQVRKTTTKTTKKPYTI